MTLDEYRRLSAVYGRRWWNDASYAAYQADPGDDVGEQYEPADAPAPAPRDPDAPPF